VRLLYQKRKLTFVFQPNLFSLTRDFHDEFAKSLDAADQVVLLPIYPARELPIPGVSAESILEKMELAEKQVCGKEDLLECLDSLDPSLILMVGAGDIDREVERVFNHFKDDQTEGGEND
jgi:UDP-N-acetylmuramate--alanine ligase